MISVQLFHHSSVIYNKLFICASPAYVPEPGPGGARLNIILFNLSPINLIHYRAKYAGPSDRPSVPVWSRANFLTQTI